MFLSQQTGQPRRPARPPRAPRVVRHSKSSYRARPRYSTWGSARGSSRWRCSILTWGNRAGPQPFSAAAVKPFARARVAKPAHCVGFAATPAELNDVRSQRHTLVMVGYLSNCRENASVGWECPNSHRLGMGCIRNANQNHRSKARRKIGNAAPDLNQEPPGGIAAGSPLNTTPNTP